MAAVSTIALNRTVQELERSIKDTLRQCASTPLEDLQRKVAEYGTRISELDPQIRDGRNAALLEDFEMLGMDHRSLHTRIEILKAQQLKTQQNQPWFIRIGEQRKIEASRDHPSPQSRPSKAVPKLTHSQQCHAFAIKNQPWVIDLFVPKKAEDPFVHMFSLSDTDEPLPKLATVDKVRSFVVRNQSWAISHLVPKQFEAPFDEVFSHPHAETGKMELGFDRTSARTTKDITPSGTSLLKDLRCLIKFEGHDKSLNSLREQIRQIFVQDSIQRIFVKRMRHIAARDTSVQVVDLPKGEGELAVADKNLVIVDKNNHSYPLLLENLTVDVYKQIIQLVVSARVSLAPKRPASTNKELFNADPTSEARACTYSAERLRKFCNDTDVWKGDREAVAFLTKIRQLLDIDQEAARKIMYLLMLYRFGLYPLKPSTKDPVKHGIYSKAVIVLRNEVNSIFTKSKRYGEKRLIGTWPASLHAAKFDKGYKSARV